MFFLLSEIGFVAITAQMSVLSGGRDGSAAVSRGNLYKIKTVLDVVSKRYIINVTASGFMPGIMLYRYLSSIEMIGRSEWIRLLSGQSVLTILRQ